MDDEGLAVDVEDVEQVVLPWALVAPAASAAIRGVRDDQLADEAELVAVVSPR
jgi:hypothetical protein